MRHNKRCPTGLSYSWVPYLYWGWVRWCPGGRRSLGERVLTDEPGRRTFCVIGVTPRHRYTTETSPQSGRYAAFLVSRQISDGNLCLGFRS
jgi:hypothetical protein